ncbi:RNA polymerase sigma factor SigZ [Pontibacter qinzhouensis]|uniref:RNA polymerase sigma factor SigZ n=1 Tax=Pontibacter qinzhouensis TaxID=2603253 RepID=A0A5C8KAS0_9BACT|nr:RNA polymerase sigma factor SigZ [Pontibacter qinzhouensis]TXK49019.1 RNA polymerase sigma factor SigZ [Pontibacter qinzhouensis]
MTDCCTKQVSLTSSAPDACAGVAPVYLAYEAQLKAFVQKRISDKDETADILQQLYLKLYKNCEQLQEVHNIKAWLYQITRNSVYDYFRESGRYQGLEEQHEQPENNWQEQSQQELEALVEPLINLLPEEYAQALRLSELEGISQKEIALQLNLSYSGAKSRVQRGRELLKKKFIECCYLEFGQNGELTGAQVKPGCTPLHEHVK